MKKELKIVFGLNNSFYICKMKKYINEIFTNIEYDLCSNKIINPCVLPYHYEMDNNGLECLTKDLVSKLSPDNIDNKYFWTQIKERFNTLSVTNEINLSIEDANIRTLKMAKAIGVLDVVEKGLDLQNTKILEIGSGYGNFYYWLKDIGFNMKNYYSIDIIAYFYHDNFFINDGETFPKNLPDFDIIYCFNVLQHLTQKQRNSYYKEIDKHLVINGQFIGGNILKHPQNINLKCWEIKDDEDKDYVTFFGQYTEVEDVEHFTNKFEKYNIKLIAGMINYISFNFTKWGN